MTTPWRRFLAPLCLISLAMQGCSATGVLNALEPRGGVTASRGIAYGSGDRRTLDVYRPRRSREPAPTVVFFYGGGWDSGSKDRYRFVGQALARHGYLTVIPDYRIYPEARWPDFLRDAAAAVRWARDNAPRYDGDPARLVIVGHSAGAYNAVMLAVDRRWLGEQGMAPEKDVAAVAGVSGPYDFLPLRSEILKQVFGPEETRPDTQPINHVDGAAPPIWLATGLRDAVVEPANTDRLAARIRDKGGEVEVRHYARLGHAMTLGSFAMPLRAVAPVLSDLTAFIDGTLGRRPTRSVASRPSPAGDRPVKP